MNKSASLDLMRGISPFFSMSIGSAFGAFLVCAQATKEYSVPQITKQNGPKGDSQPLTSRVSTTPPPSAAKIASFIQAAKGDFRAALSSSKKRGEVIDLLLNNGIDINARDSKNRTLLSALVGLGDYEKAGELIQKGAKIFQSSRTRGISKKILKYAVKAGNNELVKRAINAGAKVEARPYDKPKYEPHFTLKNELYRLAIKKEDMDLLYLLVGTQWTNIDSDETSHADDFGHKFNFSPEDWGVNKKGTYGERLGHNLLSFVLKSKGHTAEGLNLCLKLIEKGADITCGKGIEMGKTVFRLAKDLNNQEAVTSLKRRFPRNNFE